MQPSQKTLTSLHPALAMLDLEPPRLVWHYTSPEGLAGIVANRRLRASHAAFLNDPLELRIVHERTREVWEKLVKEVPELESTVAFLLRPEGLITGDAYLTSFSEEGDSLSQWRAYSANGRGYAIGFDLRPEHWRYERPRFSVSRCIYGHDALEAALRA